MVRGGIVYILTNEHHTVLYIGVTANLHGRMYEHKTKLHPNSFTARYNCFKLVYFNFFTTIADVISEEKRLKGGSRKKKMDLINAMNPEWNDLSLTLD